MYMTNLLAEKYAVANW